MKKISHKERVEASKASIAKTKKLESKRMSPKLRKGISISTGVLATGGIIAGATVGIMAAANTSELANYPKDPAALTAKDFIAGNKDETPKFDIEKSGSQTIIKATEGPVKFISNYEALFDEEKLGDFADWFYHDVSWGPEIGALSSINFLSGVQSDNGKTTLGYHTTSREGSTIIMSPDVPFDWNKNTHIQQSIAFYVLNNYIIPTAGDNPSESEKENTLKNFYPDISLEANVPLYVSLANSKIFQDTFIRMNDKSYSMKGQIATTIDADGNPTVDYDANGILKLVNDPSVTSLGTEAGSNLINLYRSQLQKINNFVNASDNDLINAGVADPRDFKNHYLTVAVQIILQLFPNIDRNSLGVQLPLLMNLLGNQDDFIDGILNQNVYLFSPMQATLPNAEGYNDLTGKIKSLYNSSAQGAAFHLRTQLILAAYETKDEKIKKLFDDLLVTSALEDKTNKEDKIGAILSVIYLYYSLNGNMSKTIGDGNHDLSYADESLQNVYQILEKQSIDKIDSVDGEWIFSQIFSDKSVGQYSHEEISKLKNDFTRFSDDKMTQLSKDMDSRIHPGKTVNGVRTPGLPIYKSANERPDGHGDSFYDSITRRISQDMLYTISHEYGHHTTMWYAQDISTMDGPENIKDNANPSGTEDSRGVVPNSQVITLPGLDSYADAGKYYLYKNAFKSSGYRNVLDKTTDGDSRTDMTHQEFKTDFTINGKIQEVDSNEDGIEGFTLLTSAFDPLFLGSYSGVKFGEVQEGNGIARDLLQKIVKDGETKIDPNKDKKEYDLNYYKEIKDLASKNPSIKTDADFVAFVKKQIISSLSESGLFGSDISAYKSGQVMDNKTHAPLYLSEDGKSLTTDKVAADGKTPLKPYIGNPQMADKGGTFGWYASSSLAAAENNDVKAVLVKFIQALTAAADDTAKVVSLDDVLSGLSIDNLEMVVGKLVTAYKTYSAVTKPTGSIIPFIDSLQLYSMAGGDKTKSLTNLVAVLSPFVKDWKINTPPTPDATFTSLSTAPFESRVLQRANKFLDDQNADAPLKLRNVTGEMILRAYYEITGETTKSIFEKIYDDSALDSTSVQGEDGLDETINDFASTIEDKIALFTEIIKKVVLRGSTSDSINDFEAILHDDFDVVFKKESFKIKLSDSAINEIVSQFKDGGSVFTFKNGVSGVAAVSYTFTDKQDVVKYKHHFTTVTTGSMPPESFYRYTSTYVEGLTRAWNQLAFAVNPELLTKPGEFYDGDPARFASEGELLYNVQSPDGITPGDEEINSEGLDIRDMYKKYYNTDKTISAMLRDRTTGLYSFLGYTDAGAEHIDGVVFTKPVDGGNVQESDVVSEVDAIYNVDNYHYYSTHGVGSTRKDLTDRESFMTEFAVMGDFENSKLKQGTYDVWTWKDTNGDGEVQIGELTAITNSEIQNGGHMNNNGKSPDTAEIIGHPEDDAKDATEDLKADFRIKVGDIKV